jgi:glycyl-tRNA synthetase beta chain
MGELLLELLSEEIPARMQQRAIEDLTALIRNKLTAAQIPADRLDGYVTPRRLTVIGDGIPERQPQRREERRGPRVGAPRAALDGFLRDSGLDSIELCEIRDTGRGEFYFAVLQHPGRAAAEVVPELLRAAINELPWPKSMRFPAASFRWVRPLISVICLFDGKIVPLTLDGIPVGRTTRGHRFLSEGDIAVDNAADYRDRLEAAYVILEQDRRRTLIAADLDRLATARGLMVKPDPGLLGEVAGLVEFPVVLMGTIDDASISLPSEVLATAMRTHQKYFSCLNPDGSPAPRFLFVANNLTADDGKTVIAGNERVLRARLTDARFFWDQDRNVPLESRVEALKDRVFHAKLGSLHDKVECMKRFAPFLVPFIIPYAEEGKVQRALRAIILAKADLSSGMVGEFPELQGVMGRYYALHDREDEPVADAIADHYKPLGPNDTCPTAPYSVIAALADKLITLVGFFGVGELPTGSRDPFGLRRAALGVIRLILENQLHLPLAGASEQARAAWGRNWRDITAELLIFIADRLKVHLRERGVRHDLIAAAFAKVGGAGAEDDLLRLLERVKALQALLATEYGADLLIAYRRASTIVSIEERRDGRSYDGEVDRSILAQPQETALAMQLDNVSKRIETLLSEEAFMGAMAELASLRDPVDDFFDKVTVNCDDVALRENRLRLLSRIRATLNRVADFSQIEG